MTTLVQFPNLPDPKTVEINENSTNSLLLVLLLVFLANFQGEKTAAATIADQLRKSLFKFRHVMV